MSAVKSKFNALAAVKLMAAESEEDDDHQSDNEDFTAFFNVTVDETNKPIKGILKKKEKSNSDALSNQPDESTHNKAEVSNSVAAVSQSNSSKPAITTPKSNTSSSTRSIVKVEGIPLDVKAQEFVTFLGIWPKGGFDGIKFICDASGDPSGYAYLEVDNHRDKMSLIHSSGVKFKNAPIEITNSNVEVMMQEWNTSQKVLKQIEISSFIRIGNLPFTMSESNILTLLSKYNRKKEDVYTWSDKPEHCNSGYCYVIMDNSEHADVICKTSLKWHNRKLLVRKIHPEVLGRWCKRNSLKLIIRETAQKSLEKQKEDVEKQDEQSEDKEADIKVDEKKDDTTEKPSEQVPATSEPKVSVIKNDPTSNVFVYDPDNLENLKFESSDNASQKANQSASAPAPSNKTKSNATSKKNSKVKQQKMTPEKASPNARPGPPMAFGVGPLRHPPPFPPGPFRFIGPRPFPEAMRPPPPGMLRPPPERLYPPGVEPPPEIRPGGPMRPSLGMHPPNDGPFDSRGPLGPFDPRGPPGPFGPRGPPGPFDPRGHPGPFDPRGAPGPFDPRRPPGPHGPRGPPIPHDPSPPFPPGTRGPPLPHTLPPPGAAPGPGFRHPSDLFPRGPPGYMPFRYGMSPTVHVRMYDVPDKATTEELKNFFHPIVPAKISQNVGTDIYDIDFFNPNDALASLQRSGLMIRKNSVKLEMLPGPFVPLPPRKIKVEKKKKKKAEVPEEPPKKRRKASPPFYAALPPPMPRKSPDPPQPEPVEPEEQPIIVPPFPEDPLEYHLKPYDSSIPEGQCAIQPMKGYFCQICRKFYKTESSAMLVHCKSKAHFDNVKLYIEKMKAAKILN